MSDVCLSDALILSGFRGGGSGGSDAAIIIPSVPFNCIRPCASMRKYSGTTLSVWGEFNRIISVRKTATKRERRKNVFCWFIPIVQSSHSLFSLGWRITNEIQLFSLCIYAVHISSRPVAVADRKWKMRRRRTTNKSFRIDTITPLHTKKLNYSHVVDMWRSIHIRMAAKLFNFQFDGIISFTNYLSATSSSMASGHFHFVANIKKIVAFPSR